MLPNLKEQEKNLEAWMKAKENRRKYGTTSYKANSTKSSLKQPSRSHLFPANVAKTQFIKKMPKPTLSESGLPKKNPENVKEALESRRIAANKKKYTPGAYRMDKEKPAMTLKTSAIESKINLQNTHRVTKAKVPSTIAEAAPAVPAANLVVPHLTKNEISTLNTMVQKVPHGFKICPVPKLVLPPDTPVPADNELPLMIYYVPAAEDQMTLEGKQVHQPAEGKKAHKSAPIKQKQRRSMAEPFKFLVPFIYGVVLVGGFILGSVEFQ